jgi:CheY-like chemotaxis protein
MVSLAQKIRSDQKVVLKMLSRWGYTADVASNGRQAMQMGTSRNYDLILMDIQMPEMDGVESMRQIRGLLGERCPVIVALTAEALEGDRERFMAEGFSGYMSKPLQAQDLQKMLGHVSGLVGN